MKKKIYIGGEFFWNPLILFSKKKFNLQNYLISKYPNKHFCLTGGGYYSLFSIIDSIKFKESDEILLPSYLCPTILKPFKKMKIKYNFFRIDKDLNIDINDLNNKITSNTKAVFFINYFGFPPQEKVKSYLKNLKKKNIVLIEDCVQSFFSDIELIGDYAFNSFRKFLPVDGSVIISDRVIKTTFEKRKITSYNIYKFLGQLCRYLTVEYQIFDLSKLFLKLFLKANKKYYEHEYVGMNFLNKFILSRIDIGRLINDRKQNYMVLANHIKFHTVFGDNNDKIVPLGLPLLLGNNRDLVRKKLMSKNIFCPIHWTIDINESGINDENIKLSNSILTIPLSFNCTKNKHDFLIKNLEVINENLS